MKTIVRSGILLVFMHFSATGISGGESAKEILKHVREKYESISDATLQFSQDVALSKIKQKQRGTLFLKKENKYRLELERQTIVTDGFTVWSYSPLNNQVLIDNYRNDKKTLSPENILAAAPEDYFATLLGEEKLGTMDVFALKLVPKKDDGILQSLKLWVDDSDWLIRKAEIVDFNEKSTTYTVEKIELNVGLDDVRFVYQIPADVEVVDLR
ncbi:MAG TPA: outer membrane lipoprotein carrier protein LolA [Bacteroidota bacterium]